MYVIIKRGCILSHPYDVEVTKYVRITYTSNNWKVWKAHITAGTCFYCFSMHGRVLSTVDPQIFCIPVHPNCRCHVENMTAILVGTATSAGINGVDMYVALHGKLPSYYITSDDAKKFGWISTCGNLAEVLPGRVIGGTIYQNRDHRLPEAVGRVWYEADFDYTGGYRNKRRLLFSNDGLLFATYDHYLTFYEIGKENLL